MRECGPDPNHRRVIARDSGNPGCPFSRALAGFGRVAATSRDFLGQRGHPASHTRFSVICPNDCHTCAMLIINCGIKRVVCERKYHAGEESERMFRQAGVIIDFFNDEVEQYDNQ